MRRSDYLTRNPRHPVSWAGRAIQAIGVAYEPCHRRQLRAAGLPSSRAPVVSSVRAEYTYVYSSQRVVNTQTRGGAAMKIQSEPKDNGCYPVGRCGMHIRATAQLGNLVAHLRCTGEHGKYAQTRRLWSPVWPAL